MSSSTLLGVLVNVSTLTKDDTQSNETLEWTTSIYTVIQDIINEEYSEDHKIFSIGIGGACDDSLFDVFGTAQKHIDDEKLRTAILAQVSLLRNSPESVMDEFLDFLKQKGAVNVNNESTRGSGNTLPSHEHVSLILSKIREDQNFLKKCLEIYENLQKDTGPDYSVLVEEFVSLLFDTNVCSLSANEATKITGDFVLKCQEVIRPFFINIFLGMKIEDLTKSFKRAFKPYIGSRVLVNRASEKSYEMFSNDEFSNHRKYLIFISESQLTDESEKLIFSKLKDTGVQIICFCIDKNPESDQQGDIAQQSHMSKSCTDKEPNTDSQFVHVRHVRRPSDIQEGYAFVKQLICG